MRPPCSRRLERRRAEVGVHQASPALRLRARSCLLRAHDQHQRQAAASAGRRPRCLAKRSVSSMPTRTSCAPVISSPAAARPRCCARQLVGDSAAACRSAVLVGEGARQPGARGLADESPNTGSVPPGAQHARHLAHPGRQIRLVTDGQPADDDVEDRGRKRQPRHAGAHPRQHPRRGCSMPGEKSSATTAAAPRCAQQPRIAAAAAGQVQRAPPGHDRPVRSISCCSARISGLSGHLRVARRPALVALADGDAGRGSHRLRPRAARQRRGQSAGRVATLAPQRAHAGGALGAGAARMSARSAAIARAFERRVKAPPRCDRGPPGCPGMKKHGRSWPRASITAEYCGALQRTGG